MFFRCRCLLILMLISFSDAASFCRRHADILCFAQIFTRYLLPPFCRRAPLHFDMPRAAPFFAYDIDDAARRCCHGADILSVPVFAIRRHFSMIRRARYAAAAPLLMPLRAIMMPLFATPFR